MPTARQFGTFLQSAIPVFSLYLVEARSLRQCGTISDQFGAVARDAGFDAYVVSVPGHFLNQVVTSNGTFEVDLTAAQFRDTPYEDNLRALLREIVANPYAAAKIVRIKGLSSAARAPTRPNPPLYDPVRKYELYRKRIVPQLLRGQLDPRDEMDAEYLRLLGGARFGAKIRRRA